MTSLTCIGSNCTLEYIRVPFLHSKSMIMISSMYVFVLMCRAQGEASTISCKEWEQKGERAQRQRDWQAAAAAEAAKAAAATTEAPKPAAAAGASRPELNCGLRCRQTLLWLEAV